MQIMLTPKLLQNQTQDEALLELAHKVRSLPKGEQRAVARVRLAKRLNDMGEFDEAHSQLRLADTEAPDHPFVYRALGLVMFRNGRIRDGLRLYDTGRWQLPSFDDIKRSYSYPTWEGQDLCDKKVLVWAEQGIGDQIMQARVLTDLLERGAIVSVECEPRLISLFKRAFPQIEFETQTVELVEKYQRADFDFQTSMFSAWRFVRSPGAPSACIRPNQILVRRLRNAWRILDRPGTRPLNIGLSWFSKAPQTGKRRSVDLSALAILPQVAGDRARFHNLQYGVPNLDAASAEFGAPIWQDKSINPLSNLDTAAAQTAALDLVISIDNASVHMSGSLGLPTWVLLPKGSEFRWQKHETKSMLYPGVHLFRNNDSTNWGMPLMKLADKLENMLSDKGS